jgi:lysozyme family protein
MAAENFDKCLARVLVYEGGKVDDPRDPGGRTAYGVTQRVFWGYLAAQGQARRDVFTITKAEIRAIYKTQYWDLIRGDDLPLGIDMVLFDAAVNSGVGSAGKWGQAALGDDYKGPRDGRIGPVTAAAMKAATDQDALIRGIDSRRLATLKTLKAWKTYGKGWSARVANLDKIAQAMNDVAPLPAVVTVADLGGHTKADTTDIKKPLIGIKAGAVVAAADPIQQVVTAISGFGTDHSWIASATAVLTITGICLTAYAGFTHKWGKEGAEGDAEVPQLDTDADAKATPVPVNDNAPIPADVPDAAPLAGAA